MAEPLNWSRVEELFLAAADLPGAERQRFLDDVCAGDEALRNEVESLIACDGKSRDSIETAIEGEAAALLDSPTPIGQSIGPYRVIREVGRGGMGAVYLASRDAPFRKEVVIKLVKRGMDTDDVLRRFHAERQILANLEHPYIARLIDGGSTEDGRPFLVMEFVEGGEPIDRYCSSRDLSVADRCRLFLKVCEAVSHAHRNLVIHRDLKPGNILITAEGCPKLLDFGVAKILDSGLDHSVTAQTSSGPAMTPAYASPEQVRGMAARTATDIYSLGAILHELLTGLKAHKITSSAPGEIERAICESEIVAPSAALAGKAGTERLRKQLRGDLDNIVMKAMRKEASRRYSSVEHLAEDIQNYLESRPILARKDSLWYRFVKFARRHRVGLAASAAVIASLMGGIVIALFQARAARQARLAAEMHRDMAIREQQRAEDRLAQIISLSNLSLSDVYGRMERLTGAMPAREELVTAMLDFLEKMTREAGNDVRLRAALAKAYLRLGDLQGDPDVPNLGDYAGALRSFQAGSALLSPVAPVRGARASADALARLEVWADLQDKTGKVFNELGRPGAADVFKNAINVVEASQQDPKSGSRIRGTLYLSLSRATSDYPLALKYAQQALVQASAAAREFPEDTSIQLLLSSTHTQVGYVNALMGNLNATLPHDLESLRIRERLLRDHPNDVIFRRYAKLAYEHLASSYGNPEVANLGRPDIARMYYKKAEALEKADLADPQSRSAQFDYATFLLKAGRVDVPPEGLAESLGMLREAAGRFASLAAAEPGLRRYDLSWAHTSLYIGDRLLAMGKYEEALAEYKRGVVLADRYIHKDPPIQDAFTVAVAGEGRMARAIALRGDRVGALEHARGAIRSAESGVNLSYPWFIADAYLTLAVVYDRFGECDKAGGAARRSVQSVRRLSAEGKGMDPKILQAAEALVAKCSGGRE